MKICCSMWRVVLVKPPATHEFAGNDCSTLSLHLNSESLMELSAWTQPRFHWFEMENWWSTSIVSVSKPELHPWTCFIVSAGLWFHGQRDITMLIALADYRLCVRYISKAHDWPTPCLHNQQRAWMNDQPLAGRVWTVKMGSHTNDCSRPWFPVT